MPSAKLLKKAAPLLVLISLVLLLSMINSNFFSLRNFARIGVGAAPAMMVAIGVTFIIIMGSIDLSMEGAVAVVAVVFALALGALGGTIAGLGFLAIPIALATGIGFGAVTGWTHIRLKIPSFMASLALGFVGVGIARLLTNGSRIRIDDPVFRALLTERFLGFPLMVYLAVLAIAFAFFIQRKTAIGRNFYAVGGGEDMAAASGLNVARVRLMGFMLAGFFYGLGALMGVARLGIAEAGSGADLMFVAITSVVVGGTSLVGGNGGVLNTVIGVLIVNVINNGMVILGAPNYIQNGVLGVLVIAAVVLSTDRRTIGLVK